MSCVDHRRKIGSQFSFLFLPQHLQGGSGSHRRLSSPPGVDRHDFHLPADALRRLLVTTDAATPPPFPRALGARRPPQARRSRRIGRGASPEDAVHSRQGLSTILLLGLRGGRWRRAAGLERPSPLVPPPSPPGLEPGLLFLPKAAESGSRLLLHRRRHTHPRAWRRRGGGEAQGVRIVHASPVIPRPFDSPRLESEGTRTRPSGGGRARESGLEGRRVCAHPSLLLRLRTTGPKAAPAAPLQHDIVLRVNRQPKNLRASAMASNSPSPGAPTSPLCHSRHLSPTLSPPDPTPAAGLGGDEFTPHCSGTSGPGGNGISGRPSGMAATAEARASALSSSRRRPSASSVAAGSSRAVTGVLLGSGKEAERVNRRQSKRASGGKGRTDPEFFGHGRERLGHKRQLRRLPFWFFTPVLLALKPPRLFPPIA